MSIEFNEFYTKEKEKRIPDNILNETVKNRKMILIGLYAADGSKRNTQNYITFS